MYVTPRFLAWHLASEEAPQCITAGWSKPSGRFFLYDGCCTRLAL